MEEHTDLWHVEAKGNAGRLHVVRKGGCCLAYTEPQQPTDLDDPDLDPGYRAFLDRFPPVEGTPAYCNTCSLRTREDPAERQAFWLLRHNED